MTEDLKDNIASTNKKRTRKDRPCTQNRVGTCMALGAAAGVAIGAGAGITIGNIALGVGVGVALGTGIGMLLTLNKR